MPTLTERIDAYLAGADLLRRAIADMSPDQLRARPVAGKWSSLEVLCHIADFEPVFADRMKRVLALDNPTLLGADENRFAAALAYDQRAPEEELAIVERTRSQMARILRTLDAAAFVRTGTHNERGPLTLEQLLASATRHIPHHVAFLNAKRQALGLPPVSLS